MGWGKLRTEIKLLPRFKERKEKKEPYTISEKPQTEGEGKAGESSRVVSKI